jgi:hypothetical protein
VLREKIVWLAWPCSDLPAFEGQTVHRLRSRQRLDDICAGADVRPLQQCEA